MLSHRFPPTAQGQPEEGADPGENEEGVAEAAVHGEVLDRPAVVQEHIQIGERSEKGPEAGGLAPLSRRNCGGGDTSPEGDLGQGIHGLSKITQPELGKNELRGRWKVEGGREIQVSEVKNYELDRILFEKSGFYPVWGSYRRNWMS